MISFILIRIKTLEKVVSNVFTGDEIEDFNKLIELSGEKTAQETIKKILHEYL